MLGCVITVVPISRTKGASHQAARPIQSVKVTRSISTASRAKTTDWRNSGRLSQNFETATWAKLTMVLSAMPMESQRRG